MKRRAKVGQLYLGEKPSDDLPVLSNVQEKICRTCRKYLKGPCPDESDLRKGPCRAYLELVDYNGGVVDRNEAYSRSIRVANLCKTTYVKLESELNEEFARAISCGRFWCPDCGGKNGEVHKKRMGNVLDKFQMEGGMLRQFVFTIPPEVRHFFHSRDMLNKFFLLVNRLIEREYGKDIWQVDYLHLFGDRKPGQAVRQFHPHINVHIRGEVNESWKLPEAKLDQIKWSYRHALSKLLNLPHVLEIADVHYSYRVGRGKIIHAIRYMSRPLDQDILDQVDDDMKHFLVLDMKGFQYIRYLKQAKGQGNQDDEGIAEVGDQWGVSPVTGSPLRVVGFMTAEKYEMWVCGRDVIRHPNGLLSVVGNIF